MITESGRHLRAMRTSAEITLTLRRMYRPRAIMIKPQPIIRILNRARVRFVLMGNFGMTGWRVDERATKDVDILVIKSHHRRAVKALCAAYPKLTVQEFPVVTRFTDPATGDVVIDVMKPLDDVYKAVFKNSVFAGRTYQVPDLEMALVCKYAALVSPGRLMGKKHTDAGDFYEIVLRNYEAIDFAKLERLGDLVYRGGGAEVRAYVEDAKAGRRLEF